MKHTDFVMFKELVVKKRLLRELEDKRSSIKLYVEARRIIEGFGLPKPDEVLAHLGFMVQWKGLDVNDATIMVR